jgi:hypothetical protein
MTMLAVSPEVGSGRNVRDHRYPGEEPHTPLPSASNLPSPGPKRGLLSTVVLGSEADKCP